MKLFKDKKKKEEFKKVEVNEDVEKQLEEIDKVELPELEDDPFVDPITQPTNLPPQTEPPKVEPLQVEEEKSDELKELEDKIKTIKLRREEAEKRKQQETLTEEQVYGSLVSLNQRITQIESALLRIRGSI